MPNFNLSTLTNPQDSAIGSCTAQIGISANGLVQSGGKLCASNLYRSKERLDD
ncbi:MAG: hypothetical protein P8O13_09895 [Porticoccaceae bacterium]|nr:hypothetical protein [Porticoccaceae bacterium]